MTSYRSMMVLSY